MPKVCSIDKRSPRGKMASAYWSWYPEPDKRVAYLMRYCVDHAEVLLDQIGKIVARHDFDEINEESTCGRCGGSTEVERDYSWAAVYIPGCDVLNVTIETCFSCAVAFRAEIIDYGERLPERNGYVAGAPANSPWARLIPLP